MVTWKELDTERVDTQNIYFLVMRGTDLDQFTTVQVKGSAFDITVNFLQAKTPHHRPQSLQPTPRPTSSNELPGVHPRLYTMGVSG